MISRITMVSAGILTIISAWLPWINVLGISQNGFMGEMGGNPGIFFIVLGALIALMGLLNKIWSAIIAIFLSIFVTLLGLNYYNDTTTGDALSLDATVGVGLYVMIIAGLIGLIGGIMRFFMKKKQKA